MKKQNKRKGFTLVELLVVIAILAILATVSVVGYTAFIAKANQSNANTEMTQIKSAVNAAVLDGSEIVTVKVAEGESATDVEYVVTFTYADEKLSAVVKKEGVPVTTDADKYVELAIAQFAEMDVATNLEVTFDSTDTDLIESITYKYGDAADPSATAIWVIGGDITVK